MSEKLDEKFAGQGEAFGPSYISDSFKFDLMNIYTGVNNPNFYFTAFNVITQCLYFQLGEYVKLNYERKYPIDLIISDQCIDKYNKIFFFILKLKRINYILSSLWKYLHSTEFKVINKVITSGFGFGSGNLGSDCQLFLSYQQY